MLSAYADARVRDGWTLGLALVLRTPAPLIDPLWSAGSLRRADAEDALVLAASVEAVPDGSALRQPGYTDCIDRHECRLRAGWRRIASIAREPSGAPRRWTISFPGRATLSIWGTISCSRTRRVMPARATYWRRHPTLIAGGSAPRGMARAWRPFSIRSSCSMMWRCPERSLVGHTRMPRGSDRRCGPLARSYAASKESGDRGRSLHRKPVVSAMVSEVRRTDVVAFDGS
jgi:hypothetical protein